MNDISGDEALKIVRRAFERENIPLGKSSVRSFPGETIVIVEVSERDFERAVATANDLDSQLPGGFVTVKKAPHEVIYPSRASAVSLLDPRVDDLIAVLSARSRTSEQQPSLRYVRDAAQTISLATSGRHHLIFGRRGVGNTNHH
jgi:hypothetical protein